MKTRRFSSVFVLAVAVASAAVGLGVSEAAVVPSTDGATTLSIQNPDSTDVPISEFPSPGRTYKLVETANPLATFTLMSSTARPGTCTNTGSPLDLSDDFAPIANGNELTARDCGGSAVVQSSSGKQYKLLPDLDTDGVPDWYEFQESAALSSAQCPNRLTCINATDDLELLGANQNSGDGFAAIDEHRGFMVSGVQVRTKTTQKDVFEILVNPQCSKVNDLGPTGTSRSASLIGRASGQSHTIYPVDGTPLFRNVLNLGGSAAPIADRLLGYSEGGINPQNTTEWVDNFAGFVNGTVTYKTGTDGAFSDRQVNQNAISPIGIHKAIRIIECVDNSAFSPMGFALFPPGIQVGHPDEDTNSIIFTQRIWHDYERVLSTAGSRGVVSKYKTCALAIPPPSACVFYQTYTHSATSTTPTTATSTYTPVGGATCPGGATPPCRIDRNFIVSKYIQWVLAMEKGHSVALIPEIQIAQYGPHFAPASGDNLDQRIVVKDGKTGVIYSIPFAFGSKSNDCFQLKPPSGVPASSCQ